MLQNQPTAKHIVLALVRYAPVWIISTITFGALSVFYVLLVKADHWEATQAIMVREEANNAVLGNGKFESSTSMKAAQELVLEISKNPKVVRDALVVLGPRPSWFGTSNWPSKSTVDGYAKDAIFVKAPKGLQFGDSELIYLATRAESPERATKFNEALLESLSNHLQTVRAARAKSVTEELETARDAARQQLAQATEAINEIERRFGTDLSDLRSLSDGASTSTNSRIMLDQVKAEIRQAENQREKLLADQKLLEDAIRDPEGFIAAPGDIINSQPGLKRLREGFVDSQIAVSQLSSKYTDKHPSFLAAQETEKEIADRLLAELVATLDQVSTTSRTSEQNLLRLVEQQNQLEDRLDRIADVRANYSNLIVDFQTRSKILQETEQSLAQATASHDAASQTSLVTPVDSPIVGDSPVGLGKAAIVLICTFAGMLCGVGMVFFISPPPMVKHGRRWSDQSGGGRRQADRGDASTANRRSNTSMNQEQRSEPRPTQAHDFDDALARHTAIAANAGSRMESRAEAMVATGSPNQNADSQDVASQKAALRNPSPRGETDNSDHSDPVVQRSSQRTAQQILDEFAEHLDEDDFSDSLSTPRESATMPMAATGNGSFKERRQRPRKAKPKLPPVDIGVQPMNRGQTAR